MGTSRSIHRPASAMRRRRKLVGLCAVLALPLVLLFDQGPEGVQWVCFGTDGHHVVSVDRSREAQVWEAATGRRVPPASLPGGVEFIRKVARDDIDVLRDGNAAAVRNPDGRLTWLRGHEGRVTAVARSPDGRLVASASEDKTVRLWGITAEQPLRVLRGHGDAVNSVAFSPDSLLVASGGADGTIRVWSVASGTELWRAEAPPGTSWRAYWNRLRGSVLTVWAAGLLFASVYVFILPFFTAGDIRAVAVSRDGQALAVVSGWDVFLLKSGTGEEMWSRTLEGARSVMFLDAPARSREEIVVCSGGEGALFLGLRCGDVLRRVKVRGKQTGTASPDGRLMAFAGAGATVSLVDSQSGQKRPLRGHRKAVRSLAFSRDSARLVSGSADKTIRLWEVCSGREQGCLTGHEGAVTSLAFSPDGSLLASGGDDGTVRLWEVGRATERARLESHTGAVTVVAFSPSGFYLASGGADTTVRLWELASGREVLRLEGHSGKIADLAFSADGGRLVSAGGHDTTIRAWHAATGAPSWRLTAKQVGVFGVRFELN